MNEPKLAQSLRADKLPKWIGSSIDARTASIETIDGVTMNNKTQNTVWLMAIPVALLALSGVAAGIAHFLREAYNPDFARFPNVVKLHAALGAVYLGLGVFQFSPRVRSNWPTYHRNVGRVIASFGLIVGLSAIFIGLVILFSGLPEQVVIGVFGVFFVTSLAQGFVCIRNKQIAKHREWMIRAFSIGLSIATMRIIFIPALILVGASDENARILSIISFSISFARAHSGGRIVDSPHSKTDRLTPAWQQH